MRSTTSISALSLSKCQRVYVFASAACARLIILFALFYIIPINTLLAQNTTVRGVILESGTQEAVAFANVHFQGTSVGTLSDTSGRFELTISTEKIMIDTLVISHLIFDNKKVGVKRDQDQELIVRLQGNLLMLDEVVIRPGENPAWPILRRVILNKERNNPDKKNNVQSQEYAKTRFDLNHFTEKIKNNILVKPFDYIWDNVRQTDDGVAYLPLLLVEKVIDHYYESNPQKKQDVIQAENTLGLPGKKMLEFTDDLYINPNFYDNFVVMLDKNFTSPLHEDYQSHHKFYLLDSFSTSHGKSYRIAFKPKAKRSLAFSGEMTIDSTSGALQHIKLQFNILSNINFVRSYLVEQTFQLVDQKHWMLAESSVLGDFTVMENVSDMTGFFGRKKSVFRNYVVNAKLRGAADSIDKLIVRSDSAKLRSSQYWNAQRSELLNEEERGIVQMIERLEVDPKYILRKDILRSFISGYIPWKSVHLGNIYTFFSTNAIEQNRFKFGLLYGEQFEPGLFAKGHLAYGSRDEKWKYGIELALRISKSVKQQISIGGYYTYDIEQLGRSFNQLPLDHLLSSWVQLSGSDASRHYVRRWNLFTETQWNSGFVVRAFYFSESYQKPFNQLFQKLNNDGSISEQLNVARSGLGAVLKFSKLNPKVAGKFHQKSDLKTAFKPVPDIAMEWRYGNEDLGSDFTFHSIKASARQQIRMKQYGFTTYYIEAGKTWGTLPYPFLNIPDGNPLVFHDDHAFNLMKFMEYASDEYIQVQIQHHFDGLLLDKIPLINKMKWRSLIFGKAYFGRISEANNQAAYLFPKGLRATTSPYYEVGFGIENIFKIARMDFIWRLSDTNQPDVYKFLVKPSFSFSF